MPEPLIHIADEQATGEVNTRTKLGKMYPGNVGDVLTRNAAGEYQAQPPATVPGSTGRFFEETLTVLSQDVLSQLSYTPILTMPFLLFINPVPYTILSGNLNVVGKTVNLPAGGYPVVATMKVVAHYYTNEVLVVPNITSFTPASASIGGVVTITGTGFLGVQSVVIGGVTQTNYVVNSPTQITVTLVSGSYPVGSTNVVVNTASGTGTKTGFTYLDPTPTITLLAPLLTAIGNDVVITGTNFTGATQVKFGGTNAVGFVVNSATQITATVADTGSAGTVQVITPYGTATSASSITLDTLLAFPRAGRVMTANSTVLNTLTYLASASSFAFAGAEAFRAFTNSLAEWWLSTTDANSWVEIELPRKARVRRYTIGCPAIPTNHLPKTWQFQAWDGATWVTLDTRTNQTLAASTSYPYTFTNNTYYTRYRLLVNSSQTTGWAIAVGELTLDAA